MGSIKIINQNVWYGNNTHVSKRKTSISTNLFFYSNFFLFLFFIITFFYGLVFDVCRNIIQLVMFWGNQTITLIKILLQISRRKKTFKNNGNWNITILKTKVTSYYKNVARMVQSYIHILELITLLYRKIYFDFLIRSET